MIGRQDQQISECLPLELQVDAILDKQCVQKTEGDSFPMQHNRLLL